MTNKVAIITGITGQDGSLLAKYLLNKSYKIIAPTRINPNTNNLNILGINKNKDIKFINYKNKNKFKKIISQFQPDEFYHLAAMTHVGESHLHPEAIFEVNTLWPIKILNFIDKFSPKTKLFFASTSEIFDKNTKSLVNENSLKSANSPYGISKLAAHQMLEYYRNIKGLYACNGILFNHESELRPDNFVSMKIFKNVARIVKHGGEPLELGNIEANKDWGYAPDYVSGFYDSLQQSEASDYVFSTGQLYSVKQMVSIAFEALDYQIHWQGSELETQALNSNNEVVVKINPAFFRPLDDKSIVGDSTHAKNQLGWINLTPFKQWVSELTRNEYRRHS
jgi:GDPmannose 4,6-dehydratase